MATNIHLEYVFQRFIIEQLRPNLPETSLKRFKWKNLTVGISLGT